jgi:hypothetical protein
VLKDSCIAINAIQSLRNELNEFFDWLSFNKELFSSVSVYENYSAADARIISAEMANNFQSVASKETARSRELLKRSFKIRKPRFESS